MRSRLMPALLVALGIPAAAAGQTYNVTEVGDLGDYLPVSRHKFLHQYGFGFALNGSGDVAAHSFLPGSHLGKRTQPMARVGGSVLDLAPVLPVGSDGGRATAINDLGVMGGEVFVPGGQTRAFRRLTDGTVEYAPLEHPFLGSSMSDLNASGTALYAGPNNSVDVDGFGPLLWFADGTTQEVNGLIVGVALTDDGRVGGMAEDGLGVVVPVIWNGGVISTLSTLSEFDPFVRDMNNLGEVVGMEQFSTGAGVASKVPVMWTAEGDRVELPPKDINPALGVPDADTRAINDSSLIVGLAYDGDDRRMHAVKWEAGIVTDLNDVLAPAADGWLLIEAIDVNNSGVILATGVRANQVRPVLLTSAP